MRAAWLRVLVVGAAALLNFPARADERERCASASEHAQDLRAAGKLQEARAALLTCAPASCPAVVRTDCLKWLAEVEAILPSIVVSALDPTGHDAIAVRVFVDGQLVADGLDGKAMLIDPGVHTLRYELAGSAPVEETVLIREAQKDRTLRVQFQSGPAKPGPLAPAVAPIAAQAPPLEAPVPPSMPTATHPPPAPASIVVPLTLAGVGLVGLGAFAVLAGSGQVQYSHCNRTPAPCTSSDINALEIKRDVAWGAGAVGLLSLGTATWLFLARRASTASVGVAVRETRGGALAELEGAF